jgi:hypothetical protein
MHPDNESSINHTSLGNVIVINALDSVIVVIVIFTHAIQKCLWYEKWSHKNNVFYETTSDEVDTQSHSRTLETAYCQLKITLWFDTYAVVCEEDGEPIPGGEQFQFRGDKIYCKKHAQVESEVFCHRCEELITSRYVTVSDRTFHRVSKESITIQMCLLVHVSVCVCVCASR